MKIAIENFWWKLSSLLVAIALWFTLILEPDLMTSASVPVFFGNLPQGYEFSGSVPDKIVLEIRGPSSKLRADSLEDTAVHIDLSDITNPGERTITLDKSNISLPFGVTFVRAVPSQLRIQFDRQLSKQVPVRIRYQEQAPAGWRVLRESVSPEYLRIIGPANKVDQVEYAETDPIDVQWKAGQKTARVHVFAGDPQVRFESSPMVTVKMTVEHLGPHVIQ
jgi:YbbR domain-containing protein